jgi:hypothetical protein
MSERYADGIVPDNTIDPFFAGGWDRDLQKAFDHAFDEAKNKQKDGPQYFRKVEIYCWGTRQDNPVREYKVVLASVPGQP